MSARAQAALLPDGRRLHLHHGPIDLIIEVEGPDRTACYRAAARRFDTILDELVAELPALRRPLDGHRFRGAVARRMARAVAPFGNVFVTPMAAVAGAVADELLAVIRAAGDPAKVHVNNGGDIAFHLGPGHNLRGIGACGAFEIDARSAVRGIATSGWQGRSHSLGIADAVTVMARNAARADVAATLIANAIDLPGHPAIRRAPATELSPDSDLGTRPVTVAVGPLLPTEIESALSNGERAARRWCAAGLFHDAALMLQGRQRALSDCARPQEGHLTHA